MLMKLVLTSDGLKEFQRAVIHSEENFRLPIPEKAGPAWIFQIKVANARAIYAIPQEKIPLIPSPMAEMVAVFADGTLYLTRALSPDDTEASLPEGIQYFHEKMDEIVKQAYTIWDKLYYSLELDPDLQMKPFRTGLTTVDIEARNLALGNPDRKFSTPICLAGEFDTQRVISILAGLCSVEQIVQQQLDQNCGYFRRQRTVEQLIKDRLNDPTLVEPWEKRLSNALKDLQCKTVTVQFSLDGQTVPCKVPAGYALNKLITKQPYDCSSSSQLFEALKELFPKEYVSKAHIFSNEISKILFRNKVYYDRDKIVTGSDNS